MKQNRRTPKLLAGLLTLAMLLSLTAVFTIGTAAAGAPLKRSYTFYQADASMLDAETENKFIKADAWANIPWSEDLHCFEAQNAAVTAGLADPNFGGKFRAMWMKDESNAYLYFHISIKDTTTHEKYDSKNAWKSDGFIFAISEKGEVKDYGGDCRKTGTIVTLENAAGTNSQCLDYRIQRDNAAGTIEIQARYTYMNASSCVVGNNFLFEVEIQNSVAGYNPQKNGWNSTKDNHYNTGGSKNHGVGILSNVKGNAPIVLKYEDKIIGLMDADAENKATLPASYTKVNETLIYNVYNEATNLRVEDASYTNALLKLDGWKKDETVTYEPGAVVTVGSTPLVLTAVMEEIAVDLTMDVVFKSEGVAISSRDGNNKGELTLPTNANGKAIAAWKDASNGKLYAPGATYTVADPAATVTMEALYLGLQTQKGAAIQIKNPTAIRFGGTLAAADLTAYGASIKGAGVIIVKADLLTSDILADGIFTADELTAAGIAFDDVKAAAVEENFAGIKENITELNTEYAAIVYVELKYEGDATGRVYSTYDKTLHCRSVAQIAEKAYADRQEMKSNDYSFKVSKDYAVEPNFPDRSYSLYTRDQLDLLKSFYATQSGS